MLSKAARDYIDSLPRKRSFCSVKEAELALLRADVPPTDKLLEFHELMAGRIGHVGSEPIIWGLVHKRPRWRPKNEVVAEETEDGWRLACADAYPTYDLTIDQNAVLFSAELFPQTETFEISMERQAFIEGRMQRQGSRKISLHSFNSRDRIDRLEEEISEYRSQHLTDQFTRYFIGDDWILRVGMFGERQIAELYTCGPDVPDLFRDIDTGPDDSPAIPTSPGAILKQGIGNLARRLFPRTSPSEKG